MTRLFTPNGLPLSFRGTHVDTSTVEWQEAVARLNRENRARIRAQAGQKPERYRHTSKGHVLRG